MASFLVYSTKQEALESIGVTITIVRKQDGSAYVEVKAPRYEEKAYKLPGSWSNEFSDADVARDVYERLCKSYGIFQFTGYGQR